MAVYQYKALTAKGDQTQGVIDADTPKEARDKLRARSIFVTEMSPVESKRKQEALQKGGLDLNVGNAFQAARSFKLPSFAAMRAKGELPGLTRLLATLLHAGIPLV